MRETHHANYERKIKFRITDVHTTTLTLDYCTVDPPPSLTLSTSGI